MAGWRKVRKLIWKRSRHSMPVCATTSNPEAALDHRNRRDRLRRQCVGQPSSIRSAVAFNHGRFAPTGGIHRGTLLHKWYIFDADPMRNRETTRLVVVFVLLICLGLLLYRYWRHWTMPGELPVG